jgi:signal transduction histidine kinase
MLAGEAPNRIKTPIQRTGTPTYDWRELRRWHVQETRLSPGSVVLFREPPLWQRDPRAVILGALIGVVPVVGIVLLVGLVKRRRMQSGDAPAQLSNLSRHLLQAHERERAAVAKKLHDDVGQRMTALTLQLRGLKAAPHDGEVQAVVGDVSEKLSSLVGEIVAVPDPVYQRLEFLGPTSACRKFCDELSATHNVTVHFQHADVPGNLPSDIALALFRVFQEATVNAVVHSGAGEVSVSLRGTPADIRLEVVDRGVGFDPQRGCSGGGVGLVAIRERLKLVKGGSSIVSRPGEGTRVEAWIPLRPQS